MNPLLKHTLEELNRPNADPVWIIGEAFMSLLKQASDNPKLNLCGGDAVDENTAKHIEVKECMKLDGSIPAESVNRMLKLLSRRVVSGLELRELMAGAFKYNKRITSASLSNDKYGLVFDKVPKLKRECEMPDCWLE